MKHPLQRFTRVTCCLLVCLAAAVAVAEDDSSQAPTEEQQAASTDTQNAQPPAQPEPEKPQDKQPQPQQQEPKSEQPEEPAPQQQQPAEPAPKPEEQQSETPKPQDKQPEPEQKQPQNDKPAEPAPEPQEQQEAKPQPEKPAEEPKWKSHIQEKHKPLMQWLEKNYPKRANRLKELGNNDPEKFNQRLDQAMKVYEPIQRAEKNNNHELAKVLREDVDLKLRRDQLLRKLPSAQEDQRQPLLDELKEVVSARFDVIIQKKQLEYNQIRGRMDWLNKKLEQHGNELQKLKDEKDQSVEKRMKELVEGKIEIDW